MSAAVRGPADAVSHALAAVDSGIIDIAYMTGCGQRLDVLAADSSTDDAVTCELCALVTVAG